jgi:hypothetical protein
VLLGGLPGDVDVVQLAPLVPLVPLGAVQRVVRAPRPPGAPGFFAHFGLFALVTAGRDTGSGEFERSALAGQLTIVIRGMAEATGAGMRIALTPLSERGERVAAAVTGASPTGPRGSRRTPRNGC